MAARPWIRCLRIFEQMNVSTWYASPTNLRIVLPENCMQVWVLKRPVNLSKMTIAILDINFSLQIKHRVAADLHAVALKLAEKLAAARRNLAGEHFGFAQPFRPVRNQIAMRRTGYRIFKNADFGGEKAGNKVRGVAFCRHDKTDCVNFQKLGKIRRDGENFLFVFVNQKIIARLENLFRRFSEGFDSTVRRFGFCNRARRKIENKAVALFFDP